MRKAATWQDYKTSQTGTTQRLVNTRTHTSQRKARSTVPRVPEETVFDARRLVGAGAPTVLIITTYDLVAGLVHASVLRGIVAMSYHDERPVHR